MLTACKEAVFKMSKGSWSVFTKLLSREAVFQKLRSWQLGFVIYDVRSDNQVKEYDRNDRSRSPCDPL